MALKDLLESGKFFKLVCGAGNEDANEVEKLVKLYSAAGCKFFVYPQKKKLLMLQRKVLTEEKGIYV